MTIITKIIMHCDYCGYEEPNDYVWSQKEWRSGKNDKNEEKHFCEISCLFEYETVTDVKQINHQEILKIIKKEL